MKIPILIEPISDDRFRATGIEPFVGSVEADTANAALAKMKQLLVDRLAQGARIEAIDLPHGANPWLDGAGMFRDDPYFDPWQQAIVDYRREANETADVP